MDDESTVGRVGAVGSTVTPDGGEEPDEGDERKEASERRGKPDDGGERKEASGSGGSPDDGGESREVSEGGVWPWSGRRRIKSLSRQLTEARSERDELRSELETLRQRLAAVEADREQLRGTVETVERTTFPVSEFVESVGTAVRRADDELAGSDFTVGDVAVTLRSRFAGAEEGLSVQLPDPGETVDPESLSTITFEVGRGQRSDRPTRLLSGSRLSGEETEYVEVPDVREQSLDGATEQLSAAGFEVSVDHQPGEGPEGTVLDQDPEPFAYGPEGATVHVVVAGSPPEA
jgi:hypothetical protein